MRSGRWITSIFTALTLAFAASAAELPAQARKAKPPPEAAKKCNVAGIAGVVAANGVCVKLSGYVSADFGARQLK